MMVVSMTRFPNGDSVVRFAPQFAPIRSAPQSGVIRSTPNPFTTYILCETRRKAANRYFPKRKVK